MKMEKKGKGKRYNNTWVRVDMEFLFECFNSIAHELAQRTREMSS